MSTEILDLPLLDDTSTGCGPLHHIYRTPPGMAVVPRGFKALCGHQAPESWRKGEYPVRPGLPADRCIVCHDLKGGSW